MHVGTNECVGVCVGGVGSIAGAYCMWICVHYIHGSASELSNYDFHSLSTLKCNRPGECCILWLFFQMVSKVSLPPKHCIYFPLDAKSTSASCVRVNLAAPEGSYVTGLSQFGGF